MDRRASSSASEAVNDAVKTFYLKVVALFICTVCGKKWTSAHGWADEDEIDLNCEFCDKPAKLTDVKDEMLELDTFNCPKDDCKNSWTLLHSEKASIEECSSCGTSAAPPKEPQQRFGRRYTFKCSNDECENKPEWNDYSIKDQKTQSCSGKKGNECGNKGEIVGITKKRYFKRKQNFKREDDVESGGTHLASHCDMCKLCLRQGHGTCHAYRKLITKTQQKENTGQGIEKILSVLKI